MKNWKNASLLITGIGMSNLGNWIYFIALNLTILHLTGSAAAVAGLFVIKPIALLLTNFWSGSVIDRVNIKKLMIWVDVIRGVLICIIPFISTLWMIYGLIFIISIVGSVFGPSSSIYITKVVPAENRQRFNSIMSMTNSSAFLLGPALSGVLIMLVGTELCIFINGVSFFLCALCINFLPNIERDEATKRERIKLGVLIKDWQIVAQFARSAKYFISIYILFQSAMLIGFAVDSQEAPYIKQHLLLSDQEYGLMVSVTGIGSLTGAFVSALLGKRIAIRWYISLGMLLTAVCYVLFYASSGFISATIAFILLGFFMSFASTGYATFYQQHVPTDLMGRFGSLADMLQGIIQITLTLLLGLLADVFSLQLVCLIFSGIGVSVGLVLCLRLVKGTKREFGSEGVNI